MRMPWQRHDQQDDRGRETGHDTEQGELAGGRTIEPRLRTLLRMLSPLTWVHPGALVWREGCVEEMFTEFVIVGRHVREASQASRRSVVVILRYALAVTTRRFFDNGDTLSELTSGELRVGETYDWAVLPRCGAVVVFSGTVRDHSDGRSDVTSLTYEAYDEQVIPKCLEIANQMRSTWSDLGRIALVHRVGELKLGESSVLIVVSAPHRPEAFEAARFGIDALKATVPIWKREQWGDGSDWALGAQHITDVKKLNDVSGS